MLTDDSLQELFQRATRASDREACPAPSELTSLAAGELTGVDRDRLLDHLATCSACAQELQAARTLKPWAREVSGELQLTPRSSSASSKPVPSKPVPVEAPRALEPSRPLGRFGLRSGLLAAGLATLMVGGYSLQSFQTSSPTADVVRGAAEATVQPSADSRWSATPDHFSWPKQQGATGYRLLLFNADAEVLRQGTPVLETSDRLSEDTLQKLKPGHSYFWTVEVEGPVRQSSLGPFWFHLEANPE